MASALALAAIGCAGAPTAARHSSAEACNTLDSQVAAADVFATPLSVVETQRLYRFAEKPRHQVPDGVAVHVRAEPGMSAPYVHRVVSCRLGASNAEVAVHPAGPTYRVVLTTRDQRTARELQDRLATR